MQTTYNEIEDKLTFKKEFKGNSASAEWVDYISDTGRLDQKQWDSMKDWLAEHPSAEYYLVKSYDTPIMIKNNIGHAWINTRKYSMTTSRLQNIIKRVEKV